MNKTRKILVAILLIIVTCGCIALGFKTRYDKGIIVTQFAPQTGLQSMGYMLTTDKNNLIMIDGGRVGDTDHVKQAIKENGGVVKIWYITHAHDDHFGVLLNILNEEDSDITIENIFLNLNPREWYEILDAERYENYDTKLFLDTLDKEGIKKKIHTVENREETIVDNLFIKILKTTSPDILENSGNNQSLVIKVSNMYKTMLFLGDLGSEAESEFLNNNIDEIKCDAVQMAHHGQKGVSFETYKAINPKICFWPTTEWLWNNDIGEGYNTSIYKTIETRKWMESLNVKQNYIAKDGDVTVRIW